MKLHLDPSRLLATAEEHRAAYARASPFPHVVLDGLVPDAALEEILDEFPAPTMPVWREYENYHEKKLETQGEANVGAATSLLLYQFNSAPFLAFLERLTGIENLLPDPWFFGGGLHQIRRGGKLGIHADFSRHGRLPLDRRLNVLIYLNKGWREEYGGHLELWATDMSRCVKRVLPAFNRTVVFTITDDAFHGHPEPLTCPDDVTRKSIALYYYTVGRPRGEVDPSKGSTRFEQRPGEAVPKGTIFDRDVYSGLKGERPPSRRERAEKAARHVAKRVLPPIVLDAWRRLR